MRRGKNDIEGQVVPLNQVTTPTTGKDRKGGPTDIDCRAYDRLIHEVQHLEELTGCAGWGRFFGGLLREADEARTQLEFAEKPRDVIKLQATIALVKSQLKKLHQPVEDLSAMRTKWPLFTGEMPWRADFDEPTGRVTLNWAGQGPAPESYHPITDPEDGEDAPAGDQPAEPAALPSRPCLDEDDPDEEEDLDTTGPGPEPDDPFGN
ncbi:MAG: hypothetical protein WC326_12915 [Candidatus Delongbacteria bacterium]